MPLQSCIDYDPSSCPFPLENLPWCVFSVKNQSADSNGKRIGIGIGASVLDLAALFRKNVTDIALEFPFTQAEALEMFDRPYLNAYIANTREVWLSTRKALQKVLGKESNYAQTVKECLVPLEEADLHLPLQIGDYTDFYASREHATTCGAFFRGKENALQPNWLHLPVGYHGRASSIVISGTPIRRPCGQTKRPDATLPSFGPSRRLDFELEMAYVIGGPSNALGCPIPVSKARDRLFGVVLLNDWSARDIQAWEYVPLGPFTAKNFASTISPWVVEFEALSAVGTSAPSQDPQPVAYLLESDRRAFDVHLEANMKTSSSDGKWQKLATSNLKYLYWTAEQMVAHQTITGCNLNAGDLFGTGTISGPDLVENCGSLLEISANGTKTFQIDSQARAWLEDGDSVCFTAQAQANGYIIGFGTCEGQILPPIATQG